MTARSRGVSNDEIRAKCCFRTKRKKTREHVRRGERGRGGMETEVIYFAVNEEKYTCMLFVFHTLFDVSLI